MHPDRPTEDTVMCGYYTYLIKKSRVFATQEGEKRSFLFHVTRKKIVSHLPDSPRTMPRNFVKCILMFNLSHFVIVMEQKNFWLFSKFVLYIIMRIAFEGLAETKGKSEALKVKWRADKQKVGLWGLMMVD
jgi:hypothetical protein